MIGLRSILYIITSICCNILLIFGQKPGAILFGPFHGLVEDVFE